jgi:hypothetical protein
MSFTTKILEFILGSKFKKEAKQLVQSDEYQNALKDLADANQKIKETKDELNKLNAEHIENIDSMRDSGINVTNDMDGEEMFRAYKEWQKKLNKQVGLTDTNLDWEDNFK